MSLVSEVTTVEVRRFDGASGALLFVHAFGNVPTSGWSGVRLMPRFYVVPPADGLWEFDFQADPPAGLVLEVVLPVSAEGVFALPNWARGVRVQATHNSITATEFEPATLARSRAQRFVPLARTGTVLVRQDLISFDDSFNPIGFCSGFGHIKMKKLHHTLTLTIEGPDEAKARSCLAEATAAGVVAAVVAVYATGGGALSAAISAFLAQLKGCLGDAFEVRVDDHSDWIEWCT